MNMFKRTVFFLIFIASASTFAESIRTPASLNSSPDQIRAEISRLRAGAIGKDGKPDKRVIDRIADYENKLSELKFKEGRSNR